MPQRWIQVVGVFDSQEKTGEIFGLQPAPTEHDNPVAEGTDLSLAVLDQNEDVLSEVAVKPEFGSCGDEVQVGTFQVFVEAPADARSVSLRFKGEEISRMAPGPAEQAVEHFGLGAREAHVVPLEQSGPADPNATYTLQAREKGTNIWETIDIGLDRPDAGRVDLNQFPGAGAIEVRVLKSSGFDSVEIDRSEIDFGQAEPGAEREPG